MLLAVHWEESKQAVVLSFPWQSLPAPLQYFICFTGFNSAAQTWSQQLALLSLSLIPCICTVSMLCTKASCPICFQSLPRTLCPPLLILTVLPSIFNRIFCNKSQQSSHDGKLYFFLDLGEVHKDAVSHSSPRGIKGRKIQLVLWQQQSWVSLAVLGSSTTFQLLACPCIFEYHSIFTVRKVWGETLKYICWARQLFF